MRKKLTYLGLGLALTVTALVSGARPAQAVGGYGSYCVTYYCNDAGCCYSCCFAGAGASAPSPAPPTSRQSGRRHPRLPGVGGVLPSGGNAP